MLANRNIVVIGGTSGIGLAATHAFLSHGANVISVFKMTRCISMITPPTRKCRKRYRRLRSIRNARKMGRRYIFNRSFRYVFMVWFIIASPLGLRNVRRGTELPTRIRVTLGFIPYTEPSRRFSRLTKDDAPHLIQWPGKLHHLTSNLHYAHR